MPQYGCFLIFLQIYLATVLAPPDGVSYKMDPPRTASHEIARPIGTQKRLTVMNLVELPYFLTTYLSADENADLVQALTTLFTKEPEAFTNLRVEVRSLLSTTVDLADVRDEFLDQGLFLLPQEHAMIHQSLLDIYAHTEAIVNAESPTKPYDVFISYASQDQPVANRLATDLSERGFVVWLDTWEQLPGHNIFDAVYKGITNARFVAVLLSQASCESEWFQKELIAALMTEIEPRHTTVLPLKIGDCQVPPLLADRRVADLSESWEDGLREVSAAMEFHRMQVHLAPQRETWPKRDTGTRQPELLTQFRSALLTEIEHAGFEEHSPFKDVAIAPIDGSELSIEVERLKPMIDASRVWINRWGGSPFPYGQFHSAEVSESPDGLRIVDTRPWPYRSKSFHFWQIDPRFRFLHRSYIEEDFFEGEDGERRLANQLVRSWALVDIVCPLIFARNLLNYDLRVMEMGIQLTWGGLQNRSLLELGTNRAGFFVDRKATEPEWQKELGVHRGSDVVADAREMALDLFLHFGWQPVGDALAALERDLRSLTNGIFPD